MEQTSLHNGDGIMLTQVTVTLPSATELEELESRLQARLSGRVRDLRLRLDDAGIVLQGLARTYHAKQLAQHAVMTETDLPIRANEIVVC